MYKLEKIANDLQLSSQSKFILKNILNCISADIDARELALEMKKISDDIKEKYINNYHISDKKQLKLLSNVISEVKGSKTFKKCIFKGNDQSASENMILKNYTISSIKELKVPLTTLYLAFLECFMKVDIENDIRNKHNLDYFYEVYRTDKEQFTELLDWLYNKESIKNIIKICNSNNMSSNDIHDILNTVFFNINCVLLKYYYSLDLNKHQNILLRFDVEFFKRNRYNTEYPNIDKCIIELDSYKHSEYIDKLINSYNINESDKNELKSLIYKAKNESIEDIQDERFYERLEKIYKRIGINKTIFIDVMNFIYSSSAYINFNDASKDVLKIQPLKSSFEANQKNESLKHLDIDSKQQSLENIQNDASKALIDRLTNNPYELQIKSFLDNQFSDVYDIDDSVESNMIKLYDNIQDFKDRFNEFIIRTNAKIKPIDELIDDIFTNDMCNAMNNYKEQLIDTVKNEIETSIDIKYKIISSTELIDSINNLRRCFRKDADSESLKIIFMETFNTYKTALEYKIIETLNSIFEGDTKTDASKALKNDIEYQHKKALKNDALTDLEVKYKDILGNNTKEHQLKASTYEALEVKYKNAEVNIKEAFSVDAKLTELYDLLQSYYYYYIQRNQGLGICSLLSDRYIKNILERNKYQNINKNKLKFKDLNKDYINYYNEYIKINTINELYYELYEYINEILDVHNKPLTIQIQLGFSTTLNQKFSSIYYDNLSKYTIGNTKYKMIDDLIFNTISSSPLIEESESIKKLDNTNISFILSSLIDNNTRMIKLRNFKYDYDEYNICCGMLEFTNAGIGSAINPGNQFDNHLFSTLKGFGFISSNYELKSIFDNSIAKVIIYNMFILKIISDIIHKTKLDITDEDIYEYVNYMYAVFISHYNEFEDENINDIIRNRYKKIEIHLISYLSIKDIQLLNIFSVVHKNNKRNLFKRLLLKYNSNINIIFLLDLILDNIEDILSKYDSYDEYKRLIDFHKYYTIEKDTIIINSDFYRDVRSMCLFNIYTYHNDVLKVNNDLDTYLSVQDDAFSFFKSIMIEFVFSSRLKNYLKTHKNKIFPTKLSTAYHIDLYNINHAIAIEYRYESSDDSLVGLILDPSMRSYLEVNDYIFGGFIPYDMSKNNITYNGNEINPFIKSINALKHMNGGSINYVYLIISMIIILVILIVTIIVCYICFNKSCCELNKYQSYKSH